MNRQLLDQPNQNYHLPKHPFSLSCGKNWKINYISRLTIPPLDHWAPQPRTWSNILLEHVLLLYYALTSYLYPTATAVLVLELLSWQMWSNVKFLHTCHMEKFSFLPINHVDRIYTLLRGEKLSQKLSP